MGSALSARDGLLVFAIFRGGGGPRYRGRRLAGNKWLAPSGENHLPHFLHLMTQDNSCDVADSPIYRDFFSLKKISDSSTVSVFSVFCFRAV